MKNKYKSIWVYPSKYIFPGDPEMTLELLKTSEDYLDHEVWLEFGTWSVEETRILLTFFRLSSVPVKIFSHTEYSETYYDQYRNPSKNSFDTLEELISKCDDSPNWCWFAIRIHEDNFLRFWKEFLEFCIDWKFIFWYGPGLGKVDWWMNKFNNNGINT